jgi:hypothetical protein
MPPCTNDGSTPNAPSAPNNLIATLTGSSTIGLSWTDNSSDEDGFKIERKTSGGSFSEIGNVGANVNAYDDGGLDGSNYVYRVRAFNANGNSAFSNEASVSTPGSGGTSNSSNLALNQPVTASSTDTNKPEANAVDGDAKTYWRSGNVSGSNPIAWLRADLGAAMTVGRVVIRWKENYYGKTYEIQVSNNEVDWTPVYSATGNSGVQDFSFTPAMAQYVRIYLTKNNKSNYRILEFEVYASGSGSVAKSGGGEDEEAIAATVVPARRICAGAELSESVQSEYANSIRPAAGVARHHQSLQHQRRGGRKVGRWTIPGRQARDHVSCRKFIERHVFLCDASR